MVRSGLLGGVRGGSAFTRGIAAIFLAGASLVAQSTGAAASFKERAGEILISATVTDRHGEVISGLKRNSFTISEDNVDYPLASFAEQDLPTSIGIVVDMSGSMRSTVSQVQAAIRAFWGRSNPNDEAFLFAVSSQPLKIRGWSTDFNALTNDLVRSRAAGNTALLDTLASGLKMMRTARYDQRALLIISDGMDNHSSYSDDKLLKDIRESDVRLFAIAIDQTNAFDKAIRLAERRRGLARLKELTETSGGFSVAVQRTDDIERAATTLSRAVRYPYVLGYRPQAFAQDGTWHPVTVRLADPKLRVYTRPGYFAR